MGKESFNFVTFLMRFKSLTILITICLWTGFSGKSTAQDVYRNTTLGFSITKPDGWSYLTREDLEISRNSFRLDDEELEEFMAEYRKKRGTDPLVWFARYPEPYPEYNPNVLVGAKVSPSNLEWPDLRKILSMTIALWKQGHSDLTIVEDIQNWGIDGLPGAFAQWRYTSKHVSGKNFPVMMYFWLISRGNVMFVVNMSCPEEGPDFSEEIFLEVLESIQIDP